MNLTEFLNRRRARRADFQAQEPRPPKTMPPRWVIATVFLAAVLDLVAVGALFIH